MYPGFEALALALLSKERAKAFNEMITEEFSKPSRFMKLVRQVKMYLF